MVAEHEKMRRIEVDDLRDHLVEVLREVRDGEQVVQITDGGRPLAQITPIRPVDAPPARDTDATGVEAAISDDERTREETARREWNEAWAIRRAMTEPYVFDQADHDRITAQRDRLIEEFGKHFPPGTDAVEMVREQRVDYWER